MNLSPESLVQAPRGSGGSKELAEGLRFPILSLGEPLLMFEQFDKVGGGDSDGRAGNDGHRRHWLGSDRDFPPFASLARPAWTVWELLVERC